MKLILLSVNEAALQFGLDRITLTKRIVSHGLNPGLGKKHLIKDIFSALVKPEKGKSLEEEQIRKTALQADILEQEIKKNCREFIPSEMVLKTWEGMLVPITQKIRHSKLTEQEKQELLSQLREPSPDEYFEFSSEVNDGPEISELRHPKDSRNVKRKGLGRKKQKSS